MEMFGDTAPITNETRKLLNKTYADMQAKRPKEEPKRGRKTSPELKCTECKNYFERKIMVIPDWYKNKTKGIYFCSACIEIRRSRKY